MDTQVEMAEADSRIQENHHTLIRSKLTLASVIDHHSDREMFLDLFNLAGAVIVGMVEAVQEKLEAAGQNLGRPNLRWIVASGTGSSHYGL